MKKYCTADGSAWDAAHAARLDEIEARIGEGEDFPPALDENWKTAVPGRFRQRAAVALDPTADIADWLRKGPGHATEINRILREDSFAIGVGLVPAICTTAGGA